MRRFFWFATLAALAPACSSDDVEVSEVTVLSHLAPCRTFEVLDCMLVDEGSGAQLFYDSIEGFMYHWGSTYRLEVDIRKIAHPVPDQSSREVHLREVLEVTPVAPRTEFTLTLRGDASPGAQPLTPAGQGFAMSFGRQIVCQDPAVCTAIADALRQPASFDLTLRHPDDPTDEQLPLTALAVAPH
ncbi:MAG TPA: DUF4377 domain-containing protein [Kofleriaceae bacterium]|nr:DUF4377 domain-containing protein [Kofleriaceae bacterium]